MAENPLISIIIPNHNGARTIGKCLESVYSSKAPAGGYEPLRKEGIEVIVVDDCSGDGSAGIIERFRCKLIRLPARSGASAARNEGARQAKGEVLFFVDADCLLLEDTLVKACGAYNENPRAAIGGTYTPLPHDSDFYSVFQSVFINYSETKSAPSPDYVATHAMVIGRELFKASGGFREGFLPIMEDVEFSHRLRKKGVGLLMSPGLYVRHIFNFGLVRSLRNGFRKSRYWTMYSIGSRDLLGDSGTASHGLKANVALMSLCLLSLFAYTLSGNPMLALPVPALLSLNIYLNRSFFSAAKRAGGTVFLAGAALYYMTLYAAAVGMGALFGAINYLIKGPRPHEEAVPET